MASRQINIVKNLDWITISLYFLLVVMGWFCIYGASYNFEEASFWDISYRYGKQLMWIGFSLVLIVIILLLDSQIYNFFAYFIYGAMLLLLLLTIFIAPDIKGSHSWIVMGPISLQPAEFAKAATCLALSKYMSSYGFKFTRYPDGLIATQILLIPIYLIILQNETGSALVYSALLLVCYRQGMPGIYLFLGFFLAVVFIISIRYGNIPILEQIPDESFGLFLAMLITIVVQAIMLLNYVKEKKTSMVLLTGNAVFFLIAYLVYKFFNLNIRFTYLGYASIAISSIYLLYCGFINRSKAYGLIALFAIAFTCFSNLSETAFNKLKPHQQTRIRVTLGMEDDPQKAGYNVNQSMIAIGSGGLTGKGFLNGTQTKLKYVPEQDTDFIFCTVGEEHGFVGTFGVLMLFLFLLLRLIFLAERQRSLFSRIYGYCVLSILFFHLAINVGMVIGLTPVIGIPLPFFSYGGSSLWSFTILLFIFLRLDASRTELFG